MTDIKLFDYRLPERLIAQRPAEKRDASRLMVLSKASGSITHYSFAKFTSLLRAGDALVINKTKVFPARLMARRVSGGNIEMLLTKDMGEGRWEAVTRGIVKLKNGETLSIGNGAVKLIEKLSDGVGLYQFESEAEAARIIKESGAVPLPPYIRRPGAKADDDDTQRYQTVFAEKSGSCAAPTAGLHFTDEILGEIEKMGVTIVPVVLHVGPGTFKPVKVDDIEDHRMDPERFEIPEDSASVINETKKSGGRIVAVGSTVTRCLESSALENGEVRHGSGETSIFIKPGWKFKAVDVMLTNFHLPKSTLLVLVCAFAGRDFALKAYEEAVSGEYRFFSYGDAMFIS